MLSIQFTILLLTITTCITLSLSLSTPCPLNFTILHYSSPSSESPTLCSHILTSLQILQSDYLRRTSSFFPPPTACFSCWNRLQSFYNRFDIRSSCKLPSNPFPCQNISTVSQFQALIPPSALRRVSDACNRSLSDSNFCSLCNRSVSVLQRSYLSQQYHCKATAVVYAASLFDPGNYATVKCLFGDDLYFEASRSGKNRHHVVLLVVLALLGLFLLVFIAFWGYFRFKPRGVKGKMDRSTTLIRFGFDEVKKATRNFNGGNMIGKGGYGNVYKGVLLDGTEVALKRFKNCSVAGDASFTHEVEVIASVRHVNLVALRGYCTATTNLEGHQRIIVTDLMQNGSLYDHLFGSAKKKLSWPIRQKIALGTARGLAYLHYGAQPSIIHRDIKASNILLDEMFEAKVADFGLAKFYSEGMTHMSTRVAGTMGYVAPEYALNGQLTERSDVFSYGVVLLELLSGKKALHADDGGRPIALSDLAWSLVRESRALDVIEDGMPEAGTPEVLEKYVLVAVICCHPQLYARPTMDQVVKMLETDESDPSRTPSVAGRVVIGNSSVV